MTENQKKKTFLRFRKHLQNWICFLAGLKENVKDILKDGPIDFSQFPNVSVSDYFISFDMMSKEDRKDITDSNLLESGLVVAKGKNVNGITFTIETQGDVRILWNGEAYKCRKDFPDDLVEAISSGTVEENGGVWIDNNWYELTIIGNNGECLMSDLFDICLADLTEDELKALIKDEIKNVISNK